MKSQSRFILDFEPGTEVWFFKGNTLLENIKTGTVCQYPHGVFALPGHKFYACSCFEILYTSHVAILGALLNHLKSKRYELLNEIDHTMEKIEQSNKKMEALDSRICGLDSMIAAHGNTAC